MKSSSTITILLLIVSISAFSQTNYIPKYTNATMFGSSVIYETGTNIGIGTTSPSYKLDVNGSIRGYSSANMDISAHGAASTVYIRSSYYNKLNNFGILPVVNDIANGASIGYVDNFTDGWQALSLLSMSNGFSPGSYDVYVRIRTNGAGTNPTNCSFGIYNSTTALYPIITNLSSLSTTYQEVYAGRYVLTTSMLGNTVHTFFSSAGVTTNYFLDYIKLVPSPVFIGGNVLVGSTTEITNDKLQVTGNVYASGKVLIGTSGLAIGAIGTHSLAVNGSAIFTKAVVKLTTAPWPDYVFQPEYKLPSLNELESFLIKHKHLPDVPSAVEVEKNGIDLGDTQAILLKKVEELTLYVIDLNKKVEELSKENTLLRR